jgi:hypothetical protein
MYKQVDLTGDQEHYPVSSDSLEHVGLVSVRPEGGMKFYRTNRSRIEDIGQFLLKRFEEKSF